mmetsp:Transcript_85796/g.229508  ORF Transcript_85796/g.229508 Transcript_85796/m.229508 type:complete len:774 (-) Transcript_85796:407-2728(-)
MPEAVGPSQGSDLPPSDDPYADQFADGAVAHPGRRYQSESALDHAYHERGCARTIARSWLFDSLTLAVICCNAVWLCYDADRPPDPSVVDLPMHVVVVENAFCFFFTLELTVRFCAFKSVCLAAHNSWFCFDFVLVLLMVGETWVLPAIASSVKGPAGLSMLRLLRLLRLTRMARLMRSIPELLTLLHGMAAAVRSVFSIFTLLILLLYVFGIVFTAQVEAIHGRWVAITEALQRGDSLDEAQVELCGWSGTSCDQDWGIPYEELHANYRTVARSMFTLFGGGTLLDDLNGTLQLLRDGPGSAPVLFWVFILYILISSFTLLNMLVGVLCEVVAATSEGEMENNIKRDAVQTLTAVFEKIDSNKNERITAFEFETMQFDDEVDGAFSMLGLQPKHTRILARCLFEDDPDTLERQEQLEAIRKAVAGPVEVVDQDSPTGEGETQSLASPRSDAPEQEDPAERRRRESMRRSLTTPVVPAEAKAPVPTTRRRWSLSRSGSQLVKPEQNGHEENRRESKPRLKRRQTFKGTRELDFSEFLDEVIRLRPRNTSCVLDICELRKSIRHVFRRMEEALLKLVQASRVAVGRQKRWNQRRLLELQTRGRFGRTPVDLTTAEFEVFLDSRLQAVRESLLAIRNQLGATTGRWVALPSLEGTDAVHAAYSGVPAQTQPLAHERPPSPQPGWLRGLPELAALQEPGGASPAKSTPGVRDPSRQSDTPTSGGHRSTAPPLRGSGPSRTAESAVDAESPQGDTFAGSWAYLPGAIRTGSQSVRRR